MVVAPRARHNRTVGIDRKLEGALRLENIGLTGLSDKNGWNRQEARRSIKTQKRNDLVQPTLPEVGIDRKLEGALRLILMTRNN